MNYLTLFITPWARMNPEGRSSSSNVIGYQYHVVGQETLEKRVIDEIDWLATVYEVVEWPSQCRRPVVSAGVSNDINEATFTYTWQVLAGSVCKGCALRRNFHDNPQSCQSVRLEQESQCSTETIPRAGGHVPTN